MKPLIVCLAGLGLVATTVSPGFSRTRIHHHHRHAIRHHVYTPEQASDRTFDIVAGSNKVRINSVGQVITNARP